MNYRKSLRPKALLFGPACGVILRRNPRLGQRIEQSAFTNVGQTNNSAFERHTKILMNQYPVCTIEPNMGIVEVPDTHPDAVSAKSARINQNPAFLQSFVLNLPGGN